MQCDSYNAQQGTEDLGGYYCEKCKNKGFIAVVEQSAHGYLDQVLKKCTCRKARESIKALRMSGLGGLVDVYRFDNFDTTEDWQKNLLLVAKAYAEHHERGKWFFVGGESGAGKTHICTALAIELLRKGKGVKYMLWRDASRMIKAKINDADCEIDLYKKADILYIDDLFKTGTTDGQPQRPTQSDINIAFEILNYRYTSRKPTIISTESTLWEILEIDSSIGGRIKERCENFCISISHDKSKNYRLR